jgi:hypothetical protein
MTISPSKDCWSRYDIDANFRVLAEWLGPGLAEGGDASVAPVARIGEAAGSTFLRPPIDWMFSFCSHGPRSVQA